MILFGRAGLTSLGLAHHGIGGEAGEIFAPFFSPATPALTPARTGVFSPQLVGNSNSQAVDVLVSLHFFFVRLFASSFF